MQWGRTGRGIEDVRVRSECAWRREETKPSEGKLFSFCHLSSAGRCQLREAQAGRRWRSNTPITWRGRYPKNPMERLVSWRGTFCGKVEVLVSICQICERYFFCVFVPSASCGGSGGDGFCRSAGGRWLFGQTSVCTPACRLTCDQLSWTDWSAPERGTDPPESPPASYAPVRGLKQRRKFLHDCEVHTRVKSTHTNKIISQEQFSLAPSSYNSLGSFSLPTHLHKLIICYLSSMKSAWNGRAGAEKADEGI